MSSLLSSALLLLALLLTTSASARTCPPPGRGEARCIELPTDGLGDMPEVRIVSGRSTTFVFDADLVEGELALEHPERFQVAELGKRTLVLIPSSDFEPGERTQVSVRYADGAAPVRATFPLVGHAAVADQQVEVLRHPRTVASLERELEQAHAEKARLREQLAWLRAKKGGASGLLDLLASGRMGEGGIPALNIHKSIVAHADNVLAVRKARSFRAARQVALLLELMNPGAEPWMTARATLVGPDGEELMLSVWQSEPVSPGGYRRLFFGGELKEGRLRGPWTLKLWKADGTRAVEFGNITFPR